MCLFLSAFFCTAWLTNCCVLGTKSTWESGVILWNGSSYCSMVSGQTHSCQLLDQSSVELVQGKCWASRGRKPAAMSISTLCWPSKNTSSIQGCSVPALFAGGNYWKMPSKWAENGMGGNKAEVEMHLCFKVQLVWFFGHPQVRLNFHLSFQRERDYWNTRQEQRAPLPCMVNAERTGPSKG